MDNASMSAGVSLSANLVGICVGLLTWYQHVKSKQKGSGTDAKESLPPGKFQSPDLKHFQASNPTIKVGRQEDIADVYFRLSFWAVGFLAVAGVITGIIDSLNYRPSGAYISVPGIDGIASSRSLFIGAILSFVASAALNEWVAYSLKEKPSLDDRKVAFQLSLCGAVPFVLFYSSSYILSICIRGQ